MEGSITAIFSTLWIFGCILLVVLFRGLRVDRFRHEMFKLRDEMFLEAAKGLIPFDHPAYTQLRATMNGFIRFAHRLAIWHMVIGLMLSPDKGYEQEKRATEKWERATGSLDEYQRGKLNAYRERMAMLVLEHFLITPPDMLFVWPSLLFTFLWFFLDGLRKGDIKVSVRFAKTQTELKFHGRGNSEELNRLAVMYTG